MKDDERSAAGKRADTAEDEQAHQGKLAALKAEVDRVATGATLAMEVAGIKTPTRPLGKKKLWISGLLSFFFGPLGWLYAAPLKEAIPVIVVYVAVCSILPNFLLVYILSIANLVSAVAGLLYAWGFNSAGKRVPILLKEKDGAEQPVRKLLLKK